MGTNIVGSHSNTMVRLQKRAARTIVDAPWDAPSTALLTGADLGGGGRGCAPPPPPEMTCGFLIQLAVFYGAFLRTKFRT